MVSELLIENQQKRGGGENYSPPPRLGLNCSTHIKWAEIVWFIKYINLRWLSNIWKDKFSVRFITKENPKSIFSRDNNLFLIRTSSVREDMYEQGG